MVAFEFARCFESGGVYVVVDACEVFTTARELLCAESDEGRGVEEGFGRRDEEGCFRDVEGKDGVVFVCVLEREENDAVRGI